MVSPWNTNRYIYWMQIEPINVPCTFNSDHAMPHPAAEEEKELPQQQHRKLKWN